MTVDGTPPGDLARRAGALPGSAGAETERTCTAQDPLLEPIVTAGLDGASIGYPSGSPPRK
jgi:hypothetical protein